MLHPDIICPHCDTSLTGLFSPGGFTVCLACREIIRFNDNQRQLRILEEDDWMELAADKKLFAAMLRWRLHILVDQLKEQKLGHSVDGISGSG